MTDITPGDQTVPDIPPEPPLDPQDGFFSKTFWKRAVERAVKTGTQAMLLAGLGQSTGKIDNADWATYGWAGLSGVLLSVGYSIISSPFGGTPTDNPSLVK